MRQKTKKEKIPLWSRIQVSGLSIDQRTYQASAIYRKELYIYGGSQLNQKTFGDFWKIDLDPVASSYKWLKLESL